MTHHKRRTFLKVSGGVLGGIALGSTVTAAARTDRFIVRTKGDRNPDDLDIVHELPGVDVAVVRGRETALDRSKAVRDYAPDIEIDLDRPAVNKYAPQLKDTSAADEPLYPLQWDKQALHIPSAHETTIGEGTRVAILDSGVAAGHPDLSVNEELSRNFTGDGLGAANPAGGFHGTHVAGIVAAQINNGEGVAGTAPATDLVDCRVFPASGEGAAFGDLLAAVNYSAGIGADVANLSLGAYPVPRQGLGSFYGGVLNTVLTTANEMGTLVIVAAGNDASDLQHDANVINIPAEGARALGVSATGPIGFLWDADGDGEVTDFKEGPESPAFYTNYGTNAIDLGAPGGDADLDAIGTGVDWFNDLVLNAVAIPVFETNDAGEITGIAGVTYGYGWVSGTSMAAPQVAGAAALVKSANPSYDPNQVASALSRAADVPAGYGKEYYGSGFLNILEAL